MSDYNITKQILEDSHEILLTVEVSQEHVEKKLRTLAKKMGKGMRIPGFRPGKAPVNIIIARLGREPILQELADEESEDAFSAAIETVVNEISPGATLRDIRLEPLTYEFIAPMRPEADPGDYRSIRIPVEEIDEAKVQELLDNELKNLQEKNKVWKPVEDRPVQYGDLVTLGIKLIVEDKTELNEEEWDFIPSETDFTLSPEFDGNIVGMAIDDTKNFNLPFPEESDSPYSGKEGIFEVEVKAVKAEELPELTDELVDENTEYETVEAFKEALEEEIRAYLEKEADNEFQQQLQKKLMEGATVHFAPATLHNEVERLEAVREDMYKSYGIENTDELLKLQGKTREEYHKELEPQAKESLEDELLLDAIARNEKMDASDYELEQYIRNAGLSPEQIDEFIDRLEEDEYYNLYIRMIVLRKKAHDLLSAIARGEDTPEPGQHPVEEAPEEPEEEIEEEAEEEAEEESAAEPEAETATEEEGTEEAASEEDVADEETDEADEASE